MKRFASHFVAGACGGLIGATVYWFVLHPAPQVIEIHELENKQASRPSIRVVMPEATSREVTRTIEFHDAEKAAVPTSEAAPKNVMPQIWSIDVTRPASTPVPVTAIAKATAIQVAVRGTASKPTTQIANELTRPGQIFTLVDQIPIPTVAVILSVMDRYDESDWAQVQRPIPRSISGLSSQQTALELGTVIAEGFIAAEAGDGNSVKDAARAILTLSRTLGVQKAAVRRCNAIVQASDKGDQALLRTEVMGAASDVTDGLVELRSPDRAALVSLGGWLRGCAALSEVVQRNYEAGNAEIFFQPELIGWFQQSLKHMPPTVLLTRIDDGLAEIRQWTESGQITKQTVSEVGRISDTLIRRFLTPQGVQQIAVQ